MEIRSQFRKTLLGAGLLTMSVMPFVSDPAVGAARQDTRYDEKLIAVLAVIEGPVMLGRGPIRVALKPPASAGTAARALRARIKTLPPDRHIYMVVRDLRVNEQPGVLYRLYLDLPPDEKPGRSNPHYAGTLNFYNATETSDAANVKNPKIFSYDITAMIRNLQAQNLLSDETTVTVIPSGTPAPDSSPSIGRIEIVEQ